MTTKGTQLTSLWRFNNWTLAFHSECRVSYSPHALKTYLKNKVRWLESQRRNQKANIYNTPQSWSIVNTYFTIIVPLPFTSLNLFLSTFAFSTKCFNKNIVRATIMETCFSYAFVSHVLCICYIVYTLEIDFSFGLSPSYREQL